MSNQVNDRLVDEIRELEEVVNFHMDYWTGTIWERMLENALNEAKKTLDPTYVNELLMQSSREMFEQEYQPAVAEWKKNNSKSRFTLDEVIF
jgi:hypothetical protein